METKSRQRAEMLAAAETFAKAAGALLTVWERHGYAEVDGYPANWPSFDELVAEAWTWVAEMHGAGK